MLTEERPLDPAGYIIVASSTSIYIYSVGNCIYSASGLFAHLSAIDADPACCKSTKKVLGITSLFLLQVRPSSTSAHRPWSARC